MTRMLQPNEPNYLNAHCRVCGCEVLMSDNTSTRLEVKEGYICEDCEELIKKEQKLLNNIRTQILGRLRKIAVDSKKSSDYPIINETINDANISINEYFDSISY
jgi:hypothetical protein